MLAAVLAVAGAGEDRCVCGGQSSACSERCVLRAVRAQSSACSEEDPGAEEDEDAMGAEDDCIA